MLIICKHFKINQRIKKCSWSAIHLYFFFFSKQHFTHILPNWKLMSDLKTASAFVNLTEIFKIKNIAQSRDSSALLLQAWQTESFAWICTAELNRSWEQTSKTPCKTTRKPLVTKFEQGEGDDQQYLKCTNCSRSLCTTCTLSTLELQCLQHVEESSEKVMGDQ